MLRADCVDNPGFGEESGNVVVLGLAPDVERRGELVPAPALDIACPGLREYARVIGNTETAPLISTAYIEFAILIVSFKEIRRDSCSNEDSYTNMDQLFSSEEVCTQ